MADPVSSRNDRDFRLFAGWSSGVRLLADGSLCAERAWEWDRLERAWSDAARVRPYVVSSWYRGSLVPSRDLTPVVWAVVARCMGHRLDRGLVFRFPRVAALCTGLFFRGRWKECEGVVGGDVVACYFYARALGGRLPDHLHNRVILEYSGTLVARRYLSDFCGVAQNLG